MWVTYAIQSAVSINWVLLNTTLPILSVLLVAASVLLWHCWVVVTKTAEVGRILHWCPSFPTPGFYILCNSFLGGTVNRISFTPVIRLCEQKRQRNFAHVIKAPNHLTVVNHKGDDIGWACLNEMSPWKGLNLPKGRDLRHESAYGKDGVIARGRESPLGDSQPDSRPLNTVTTRNWILSNTTGAWTRT